MKHRMNTDTDYEKIIYWTYHLLWPMFSRKHTGAICVPNHNFRKEFQRSLIMTRHEGLIGRLAVLTIVAATALLFSQSRLTNAGEEKASANEEYLVIGRDKTPDAVFYDAASLEKVLNDYAKQGWKVRAAATLQNSNIILARPASSR